jgi:hypothetical protein
MELINCEAKRNAERKEYNSILECMKKRLLVDTMQYSLLNSTVTNISTDYA